MTAVHPGPGWSDHCGDRWRAHVRAATGRDICDIVGPSPRRTADWVMMMKRLSVRSMAGVIAAVHGGPLDIRRARRGDIVQEGWAIGICRGELAEFFDGEMIPIAAVDRIFPVSGWPPHG